MPSSSSARAIGRTAPDVGLLLLRVGPGALLIALHGLTRLGSAAGHVLGREPWGFVTMVGELGFPVPALFAVASAVSESVVAVLVMAGWFTRAAALLVAANFLVATTSEAAKGDPFELPGLYLLWALVLVLTGPGRLSVDARLARRR